MSHLHADNVKVEDANEEILVTDGTMVHNLHKDTFYIPDPTLSFVGTPYYVATFTLFEFQAITIAALYSGRADLPSVEEMRKDYADKIARKGAGRNFHSLKDEEQDYVRDLIEWVNAKGVNEPIEGHTQAWIEEDKLRFAKIKAMFQVPEKVEALGPLQAGFFGRAAVPEKLVEDMVEGAGACLAEEEKLVFLGAGFPHFQRQQEVSR